MNFTAEVLIVASAVTGNGAASLEALLEKAIAAGVQKDLPAWLSLNCQTHAASDTDTHLIKNFARAYLEEPSVLKEDGVVKELYICVESATQKETCLVVPVVQRQAGFCLRLKQ
jgi:hypothetical protein